MKKKTALFLALILIVSLAAGCSAGYDSATTEAVAVSGGTSGNSKSASYDMAYETPAAAEEYYAEGAEYDDGIAANSGEAGDYAEKLIYSASAHIETTDFENSVKNVYDLIEFYHAYLESSYITGQNYSSKARGYQPYRYASFTIRVPSTGYKNLTQNLEVFGNVLSLYESMDNITQQFYDAQARLDTYKIEEERVLSMLEKADNVTDMIELESRLSDIRYNIESTESRLRVWQNQVDYSTVTIELEEVAEYTEKVEPQRTYWQQVGDGFKSSLKGVGRFFTELFKDFVIAIPVLVLLAAVAVVVVLIVKKIVRARNAKREKKDEPTE